MPFPLLGKITLRATQNCQASNQTQKLLALGDASELLKAADAILRIGHRGVTSWGALVHMLTTGGGVDGSGLLATIVKSNLMPLRRYQITSMVREYILLCLASLSCSFEHPLFFARSIPSLCTVRITVSWTYRHLELPLKRYLSQSQQSFFSLSIYLPRSLRNITFITKTTPSRKSSAK
jgi:hypothetical protein